MENAQNAKKVAVDYVQHARQDHKATLQRKQLIEARKEFIENQSKAKVSLDCLRYLQQPPSLSSSSIGQLHVRPSC